MTPQTFHLINADTIAGMKRGSYLVNACRGSMGDEQTVAAALGSGQLAGYAADVFEMEKWQRGPAERHPGRLARECGANLVSPHLGSAVREVRIEIERGRPSTLSRHYKSSGRVVQCMKSCY